jgi:hypothetical protein
MGSVAWADVKSAMCHITNTTITSIITITTTTSIITYQKRQMSVLVGAR